MFTDYVQDIMKRLAVFELIHDGQPYYGSIRGTAFQGVWAQGKSLKDCEKNLREVLEEWLLVKIRRRKLVPSTRKYDINSLLK